MKRALVPAAFGFLIEAESDCRNVAAEMIREAVSDRDYIRAIATREGVTQFDLRGTLEKLNPLALNPDTVQNKVLFHVNVWSGRRASSVYFYIPFEALTDSEAFARWRATEVRAANSERLESMVRDELRARLHSRAMLRLCEKDRSSIMRRVVAKEKAARKKQGGAT